ncbi:MAG: hypothetical protein EA376_14365 [Phycisphaeraceae bacterium]|nr:MAG: hypothetical protein EA376_14365 [Phycisphaeraceae bacterium]
MRNTLQPILKAGRHRRSGFTLLEALIASVVLATIVLAVGSSLSAARQHSMEAEKLILATICADDLLSELASLPYDELITVADIEESEGSMTTLDGAAYPSSFWQIGRSARVREDVVADAALDVAIRGRRITVTAYNEHRVLAQVETFIPEPAP